MEVDPSMSLRAPKGDGRLPRVLDHEAVDVLLDGPTPEDEPHWRRVRDDAVLEVLYSRFGNLLDNLLPTAVEAVLGFLLGNFAAIALATDFNPGTSPTVNFPLMLTIGVSQIRLTVAEAVLDFVTPIQERVTELMGDPAELEAQMRIGADRAREMASRTVADVNAKIGFVRP